MAFVTGSATSWSDLLTFIKNALTANGWSATGDVVHKGTCYVGLSTDSSTRLGFRGSNDVGLSDVAYAPCHFRAIGGVAVTFPLTCDVHIFTAPDEVYVVINHGTVYYQSAMFGQSPISGLGGTGNYCAATGTNYFIANQTFDLNLSQSSQSFGATIPNSTGGGPMFSASAIGNNANVQNSHIDADLDGEGWSPDSKPPFWYGVQYPLLNVQPNLWNGETVLVPYTVWMGRGSSKYSVVLDPVNLRACRNNNLTPGEIITLGSDQWKTYPMFKKDITAPNGPSAGGAHSGTASYAIRYTGT